MDIVLNFRRVATAVISVIGIAAVVPSDASAQQNDLLDVQVRPLADSKVMNLRDRYAGQVLLVVNTASNCVFTSQYEGLEKLHQEFKDRGFVVLGFPSNDFANQEPGEEKEIASFCLLNYGVSFPMFQKVRVKKEYAHPLFHGLAKATGDYPGWNFHKYLIGRDGQTVASYGSFVTPQSRKLRIAIEALLADKS